MCISVKFRSLLSLRMPHTLALSLSAISALSACPRIRRSGFPFHGVCPCPTRLELIHLPCRQHLSSIPPLPCRVASPIGPGQRDSRCWQPGFWLLIAQLLRLYELPLARWQVSLCLSVKVALAYASYRFCGPNRTRTGDLFRDREAL